jgi:uncharacterized protein YodC (DUF2158 family)
MTNNFQVGDVVTLKSGGLPMTVVKIRKKSLGHRIECVWFESQVSHGQRMAVRSFSADALIKAEPAEHPAYGSASVVATLSTRTEPLSIDIASSFLNQNPDRHG